MRISTKGRYALRLMLDIAMNDAEGKPVRVKDIAKRQEVSGKYLEQIVSVLTKAGYLRSIRGPQGGYLLTKHPNEYTVGMILRITEGSMEPVPCLEEGSEVCERMEECIMISEAFFYKEEQNEFLQNRKVSRNLTKNIEVFLKLTFLYFGREG